MNYKLHQSYLYHPFLLLSKSISQSYKDPSQSLTNPKLISRWIIIELLPATYEFNFNLVGWMHSLHSAFHRRVYFRSSLLRLLLQPTSRQDRYNDFTFHPNRSLFEVHQALLPFELHTNLNFYKSLINEDQLIFSDKNVILIEHQTGNNNIFSVSGYICIHFEPI